MTFDQLSSVSGEHHQGIRIDLCPSCMPIRAYECAEEVTRSTYSCIGDREQPVSMSWTSTRVDLTWRRAWSDWILAGLVGAGAVAVLLQVWRRVRLLLPGPSATEASERTSADGGEQVQLNDRSPERLIGKLDTSARNPGTSGTSGRRAWRNKKAAKR
jgi:hypothetical protein